MERWPQSVASVVAVSHHAAAPDLQSNVSSGQFALQAVQAATVMILAADRWNALPKRSLRVTTPALRWKPMSDILTWNDVEFFRIMVLGDWAVANQHKLLPWSISEHSLQRKSSRSICRSLMDYKQRKKKKKKKKKTVRLRISLAHSTVLDGASASKVFQQDVGCLVSKCSYGASACATRDLLESRIPRVNA